jgi:hypothetical protein
VFLEWCDWFLGVERWSFLTNHARVLLCIARDLGVRLRDLSAGLGITERSAHAIVADLAAAGYLVKHKHGRRSRYQIQAHLPLHEPATREPAIGDVLALLAGEAATGEPSDADSPAQDTLPGAASGGRDPLPEMSCLAGHAQGAAIHRA